MSDYPEIAARFARDTAGHQMTVLHDDGLYRHLVFREPMHSFYWFELITTPNQLVFSGDGNSYVFRRATDMFQFFRSGIWRDGSHHINPGYWSEKLTSGREAATSYSEKLFEAEVTETLTDVEGDYPGIAAAWAEHVESEFNTEYEEEAVRALSEFRFGEAYLAKCRDCDWEFEGDSYTVAAVKARGHRREAGDKHTAPVRDLTFTFSDMGEMRLQDFDWWFLWACHAIVWGIARYDRVRKYGLQALATPKAVEAS
ncbi:hypothetical protein [Streptomyces leeuwenhoekii]|uniref:hypothetical protein n=1 Tax=Streptomyces leeuwenhoekii TaxID=1437453 RepID=UPI00065C98AD|nr:hypothetical protein [Streptomyces leeuwenhoekii]